MPMSPPLKSGLTLGATRELLLPATLLGCFALYYFGQQPLRVVFACAVPMLLLYALAPLWAARSAVRFDRDSVGLLAARSPRRLRARYRRALGMRLFAPPALLAERKAMVLLECGDARGARRAYQDALDELGPTAPLRVVLGYGHASFATGDDASAIAMYRRVLASTGALPGVERKLAYALVRHGEDLRGALALLDRTAKEIEEVDGQHELTLLRALAFAKLGESARARELLAQAAPARAASAAALRAQIIERLDGAVAPRG
jgi:tetratricopeptide (TPR) repeat protein